jgi:hypothetical protein
MGTYADLMQRLLEIQRDERRSPKLIAEDEQLMRGLRKMSLGGESTQSLNEKPSQRRFKV